MSDRFDFEDLPDDLRQPELEDRPLPKSQLPVVRKEPKRIGGVVKDPFGRVGSESLNGFYESVDHRELNEALTWAGNAEDVADPKWLQLQYQLVHPKTRNTKFSTLCRRFDIQLPDLLDFWRNWKTNSGTIRMMEHLPQVMEDVAVDSKSRTETCPDCAGEGFVKASEEREETEDQVIIREIHKPCKRCYGRGAVRVMGNRHARDQLFEMAGLTSKTAKGKAPMVAIQQNFGSGELPDTVQKISKILEKP